jgi:hypothetical protein
MRAITEAIYNMKIDYGCSWIKVVFVTIIHLIALEVHMTTCRDSPRVAVK